MLKRKKAAIIGAGRGGTAFLQMLSDYRPLEIVGIAESICRNAETCGNGWMITITRTPVQTM